LKLITTAAAACAATLLSVAPASAAPLPTWYGTWVWEEALGRDGGGDGMAIFVTHTLTLGPAAGATGCRLTARGYQTDEQLKCTATPEMESVVVKLYKFRPADPGRGPSGTRLFRMTRAESGVVTRLETYGPTSDTGPTSGRLFRRVG